LGVEPVVIKGALENFAGTWRRFEYKGDCNGAPVYDDYAHHPTEIRSVISGVREKFPDKKITVAFQPHTFSRTRELFSDFVEALSLADQVLLIPIYPARKEDTTGVSSEGLMEALQAEGVSVSHFHTLLALGLELRETVTSDEVVLLLGAGEITNVAKELV
ncbi:UDP-N-acetylmuramate--L-alanine ligase, partial [bacterium]|nr:UDP-N-acetylmuramate--L-alanine ligase [bacterium]